VNKPYHQSAIADVAKIPPPPQNRSLRTTSYTVYSNNHYINKRRRIPIEKQTFVFIS
jgi:hypothetical protein